MAKRKTKSTFIGIKVTSEQAETLARLQEVLKSPTKTEVLLRVRYDHCLWLVYQPANAITTNALVLLFHPHYTTPVQLTCPIARAIIIIKGWLN